MKTLSHNLKETPKQLYVHIDRPTGLKLVGTLNLEESPFGASFRYAPSWIEDANAFPLDPINLPLRTGEFASHDKYLVLGSLFDAAPDLWGRRLIAAFHGLEVVPEDEGSILLLGQGNGVGALMYSTDAELTREQLPPLESLPLLERDLDRTHQAAFDVIEGKYSSRSDLAFEDGHLLAGSSAIGGARAKAVVRDQNNALWIAKFAEPKADFDRQRMEYANLRMAQASGMEIPQVQIAQTHLGSVLLLKRFDRDARNDRLHYASAISFISHVYEDKRHPSALDKAKFSYAQIAEVIGKVCVDATSDRRRLFAQMILNFLVKNTDDHLKNFGFVELEKPATPGKRFRLSPAFDIVTQASPVHQLFTSFDGVKGDVANAIDNARAFGLTLDEAQHIVDKVRKVVEQRNDFYQDAGLQAPDIARINQLIGNKGS